MPLGCERDYVSVTSFLQAQGILPSLASPELKTLRKVHHATYSLILWRFRITRLPKHGKVFLDELASDALQVIPQALQGYRKPTALLVRSMIENVIRHIYYLDHPIEFQRTNLEKKWYPKIEEVFEYLFHHPGLAAREKVFDAIGKLKQLYGELSVKVHGQKVAHLEMRRSLVEILFKREEFTEQANWVRRCAEASNFLLLTIHEARVGKFSTETKRIFLRTLSRRARRVWQGLV